MPFNDSTSCTHALLTNDHDDDQKKCLERTKKFMMRRRHTTTNESYQTANFNVIDVKRNGAGFVG